MGQGSQPEEMVAGDVLRERRCFLGCAGERNLGDKSCRRRGDVF